MLNIILVIGGVVILGYGLYIHVGFLDLVKKTPLRKGWVILLVLALFFTLGYIIFAYWLVAGTGIIELSFLKTLVSCIFFFGAIFVVISISFISSAVKNLKREEEEIQQHQVENAALRQSLQSKETELNKRLIEVEKMKSGSEDAKLAMLNLLEDSKELEGKLKEEKDRAQAVTSSIGEGLYVVDKNYNTVVVNEAAGEMLGILADKLIGQNLSKIVKIFKGDSELKTEDRPVYKTLVTGKALSFGLDDDLYLQTATGKKIPVSLSTSPLKEGTEVTGAVVVFRDITSDKQSKQIIEQKVIERTAQLQKANEEVNKGWLQLQQEKSKLSASIENMPLGFLMTDIAGNLLVVNSLARKTLGSEDDSGAYEKLKEIVKPKLDLPEYIKTCSEETKTFSFSDFGLADGRFLRVILSPIISETKEKQKKCVGVVILVEDVTEAKVLERSKDEFFSIASHELRTPLTAIRGNASLIKDVYMDKLKDPELVGMINDIHDSAIRLINIVNDFLNVSRLEMGKIEFKNETFDIVPLVNGVITELTEQATQKKLLLKSGSPDIKSLNVFSDSSRVKEVLINLVGNAIKYTEKGEINIDLAPINGYTKISVRDTGQGISIENQKLLFHKFQQAGASLLTRDTTRSTGLGLYISKMIVEGIGGKIWLEKSEEGKGSTFSFSLPIAEKT